MSDKFKANFLFMLGIVLLLISTVVESLQMPLVILGGLISTISLYFEVKLRFAALIAFFKRM